MAVPFSSLHQKADRLQQMAGQITLLLTQARRRPLSSALRARLAKRGARFHALALDTRAAEIAERAGCAPPTALPVSPSAQRRAQRGTARHGFLRGGQLSHAGLPRRRARHAPSRWLLVVLLGIGLAGGTLWACAGAISPSARPLGLVACTPPAQDDPVLPCPRPTSPPSTTLLGTCPQHDSQPGSPNITQIVSCTEFATETTTLADIGVMAIGLLCLLSWLWTVVRAIGATGQSSAAALGQVVKQFFIAAFVFLVAWSIQAWWVQLEQILLASAHDTGVLPFQTIVFLADVLLVLVIRVGVGLALLKMLLSIVGGAGAFAEGSPRALAVTRRHLTVLAVLVVVLVLSPWFLNVGAQIVTGGFSI
jgi:hypothetical protein